MKRLNQTGSHILAVALGIVVVGVIAFAGYRVMNNKEDATATKSISTPSNIESKADLEQASESLDSANTDINSNLNSDSLNDNLDDLL